MHVTVLRIRGRGFVAPAVYREPAMERKAMLMAFSLRKGKATTRTIRRSPVPRAEGHQRTMNHTRVGFAPHSGHSASFAIPARS
jgi:hypothetical protein